MNRYCIYVHQYKVYLRMAIEYFLNHSRVNFTFIVNIKWYNIITLLYKHVILFKNHKIQNRLFKMNFTSHLNERVWSNTVLFGSATSRARTKLDTCAQVGNVFQTDRIFPNWWSVYMYRGKFTWYEFFGSDWIFR